MINWIKSLGFFKYMGYVLPWYKKTRGEYLLDKPRDTTLITLVIWGIFHPTLGLTMPWAFAIALGLYWAIPKLVYWIGKIYKPDPLDWVLDLITCAFGAPFYIAGTQGWYNGSLALTAWTILFLLFYRDSSP
jgi:hypothetical protein